MSASAVSHRRLSAFTLIELLVVVTIIALLVSVLLPALREARVAGVRAVCASQQRQVGTMVEFYVSDYRGLMPDNFHALNDKYLHGRRNRPTGLGKLIEAGYIEDPNAEILYCPGRANIAKKYWRNRQATYSYYIHNNASTPPDHWSGRDLNPERGGSSQKRRKPIDPYMGRSNTIIKMNRARTGWHNPPGGHADYWTVQMACWYQRNADSRRYPAPTMPHAATGVNLLRIDTSVEWLNRPSIGFPGAYWNPNAEGSNRFHFSGFWDYANREAR